MKQSIILIFLFCIACEYKEAEIIRRLDSTVFEIRKITVTDAKTNKDSNIVFQNALLHFGKQYSKEKPRIGRLVIDKDESSFYYSSSNTVSTYSNGEKVVNNLFIQSISPEFYNPDQGLIPYFNLNSDGVFDLKNKVFLGSIVFMKVNSEKVFKLKIEFQ